MSMTDEQIEQNAEKYADQFVSRCFCGEWNEVILRFTAGAHSRDDEVNDLLSQLEDKDGYIAHLRKELDKLHHPWISVEERLPEKKKEHPTGYIPAISDDVLVRTKDGRCGVGYYDFHYGWWHIRGVGAVDGIIQWAPIPEVKEGE